jgi:hypothetical protein
MAKGARRLGHADLKEEKYMKLISDQLKIIATLVERTTESTASSRRLEGTIGERRDAMSDLSEKSWSKHESSASDGAKTSGSLATNSPENEKAKSGLSAQSNASNDPSAKGPANNDPIATTGPVHKMSTGDPEHPVVFALVLAVIFSVIFAIIFAPLADSIKIEAQSLWLRMGIFLVQVMKGLRILATFVGL